MLNSEQRIGESNSQEQPRALKSDGQGGQSSADPILVNHKQTGRQASIGRRLGSYGSVLGQGGEPTVVVIAGMHGNEPSGIFAFQELLEELQRTQVALRGRVIGLAGNLPALQQGVRFIDRDLNRVWQTQTQADPRPGIGPVWSCDSLILEARQRDELYAEIRQILGEATGPCIFVDLHTTSSQSPPFMPFDDTLKNRDFVGRFPVPAVLGLEEFLPGTLLSYLNNYEVVTFGYEAGQHDDPQSIVLHREMLWCALQFAGCLPTSCRTRFAQAQAVLRTNSARWLGCYEVLYRYDLQEHDVFRMEPGFSSFQAVRAGQRLATKNAEVVLSPFSGAIFMPLYQSKGNDGFFLIRRFSRIWLWLSRLARHGRAERWLGWLPGVQVQKDDNRRILVDPRIARFLERQVFHLLGYRRSADVDGRVLYVRRDR